MDAKKYKFLQPRAGYIVIKSADDEAKKKSGLSMSGDMESRSYARIVCFPSDYKGDLKLGQLVVYNEFEGQELYQFGELKEDGVIVIKEDNIILTVKE